MKTIRHCKICLNPDTRPRVVFDEEGVCLACRLSQADGPKDVDWAERRRELEELGMWGRANSRCSYDCIIGVSGGKGFLAPFVVVRRKADGQLGSLEFQHEPRLYFHFEPDSP